jgi:DNA-binding response OmpR family regulator
VNATKTVLLVDDDPDIRTLMRTFLQRAGYRVVTAADGNEALTVAEREAPDVVVVDMLMPRKSGFLVLEKLKVRKEAGPRFIMITGNDGPRHRTYALQLGADEFLLKPFAMERLVASVRRLCPLTEEPARSHAS